jgi:hypothetical protein
MDGAVPASNTKEQTMNSSKIIEILEAGGVFDSKASQLVHPSFRKGARKLSSHDISWNAVCRKHGTFGSRRLVEREGQYTLSGSAA